jgi:hypothetical protein
VLSPHSLSQSVGTQSVRPASAWPLHLADGRCSCVSTLFVLHGAMVRGLDIAVKMSLCGVHVSVVLIMRVMHNCSTSTTTNPHTWRRAQPPITRVSVVSNRCADRTAAMQDDGHDDHIVMQSLGHSDQTRDVAATAACS